MAVIKVENLVKDYTVIKKKNGLKGALSGLFIRKKETVRAVDDISFSIEKGDIVGYIGPNGSGKSTTVKMMSGILRHYNDQRNRPTEGPQGRCEGPWRSFRATFTTFLGSAAGRIL